MWYAIISIYPIFTADTKNTPMKKISILAFPFAISLAFSSCFGGKPKEEETKTTNPLQAIANMEKNVVTGTSAADAKMKARKAKGDTLAMPYADLEKYLPASLDGYKVDEQPTGTSMNMTGMSYSSAEVSFKNDKGNNVKVTLIDYNAAYGMYSGMTAMWASGLSVDSPEEKADGIKFDGDVAGWEDYHKKTKEADVTLGIGYRFYLTVHAENQDNTDFAKSVAKSIDLSKLSSL